MKNTPFTIIITCVFLSSLMVLHAQECTHSSKPWREVASGSQSNIQEATRQVIQNQEEWKKWWAQHNTVEMYIDGKSLPQPAPKVDFEQETVLVATLGRRSTGGHSIRFTQLSRTGEVLTATLQLQSPGPDDMVTMALTSPFAVIAIPKHPGPVKFVEEPAK